MKKIKKKYHLLVSRLITALLGIFGVSCVYPEPEPVTYGPPIPQDFLEVDGEVINEESKPLESMQVIVNTSHKNLVDTVYTNASGEFERAYDFSWEGNDTLLIEVNDTSDVYLSETVKIPFSEMTKETKSGWSTEYSVDVKLQLKKKE